VGEEGGGALARPAGIEEVVGQQALAEMAAVEGEGEAGEEAAGEREGGGTRAARSRHRMEV
jgi:hypothetical protein